MKLDLPCKSTGLYIMKKSDFDPIAYEILLEHQPEVLKEPMPLDIDKLIYDYNIDCRDERLSESGSILGMITFADQKIPVYDESLHETVLEAKEGTILIEKTLVEKNTRYRFTKAHEFSHWILHRKFYSPIKHDYNFRFSDCSYIACRQEADGRKNPVEAKTDEQWAEWQSDCLSAALLMPAVTFVPTVKKILEKHGFSKLIKGAKDERTMTVLREIANIYRVSVRSASIRLNTYGFYENAVGSVVC